MSNSDPFMTRRLPAALAAMLLLAAASTTQAASATKATPTATSAQAPVEELQELDEIWIRGKSLSDMIEDAEDAFVRRYNKVNKKNDFDVVCDYLHLDRNSLALRRTCVPYFIGYLSAGNLGPIPQAGTSMCSGGYYADTDGSSYYSGMSCTPAFSSFSSYAVPLQTPTIVRWPARPGDESKRQVYVRNVMRAIYRDQALLDRATTLAALYQDMKAVQEHYQKIKAEDDARKQEERRLRREQRGLRLGPAPPNKGPRI